MMLSHGLQNDMNSHLHFLCSKYSKSYQQTNQPNNTTLQHHFEHINCRLCGIKTLTNATREKQSICVSSSVWQKKKTLDILTTQSITQFFVSNGALHPVKCPGNVYIRSLYFLWERPLKPGQVATLQPIPTSILDIGYTVHSPMQYSFGNKICSNKCSHQYNSTTI